MYFSMNVWEFACTKKKDTQKAQNMTKLTKSILVKIGNQSNTIKKPLSYQKVWYQKADKSYPRIESIMRDLNIITALFSLVLFYIFSLLFTLIIISGLEFIMGPFGARIIDGVGICGPPEDETSLCAKSITATTSSRVHHILLSFTISFTVLQR